MVSLWRDTDILITQNGTGIALNFCQLVIFAGPPRVADHHAAMPVLSCRS
jgi:hypothetical protein